VTALGGVLSLQAVYGYEVEEVSGFPVATVIPLEAEDKILDNTRNERTYKYRVRVMDDMNAEIESRSAVETRMMGVGESILDTLDSIDFSSGGGYGSTVTGGEWQYEERASGPVRMIEYTVAVKKVI